MDNTIDISHEPDLGYVFYPPATDDVFGNPRLDVILHQQPTLRHYDPHSVRCTLARGEHVETILFHYAATQAHYRICAGRILIVDRAGKDVEAFCFGGTLDIFRQQAETICVFQSPVPILDLNTYRSPDMLLANEVEILIAERRAAWDPQHPHEFEMHLAQLEPEPLFVASLDAVAAKFASHPLLQEAEYREFYHLLQQEMSTLKENGRWPLFVPKFTDLL